MAKPIRTKTPGSMALSESLDSLNTLAQVYATKEQMLYKRAMEEREYQFKREQFTTANAQWRSSFDESMRRFDETQDQADRHHSDTMSQRQTLQTERVVAQEAIASRTAAIRWTELRDRREHEAEELSRQYNQSGQYLKELELVGENPDYQTVTSSAGDRFGLKKVDWLKHLQAAANEETLVTEPEFFNDSMTKEIAASFAKQLEEGDHAELVIDRMNRADVFINPVEDNEEVLGMIEHIAVRANDGGREEDWNLRTAADKQQKIDGIINNLESLPYIRNQHDASKIRMMQAEAQLRAEPFTDIAQTDGADVYTEAGIAVTRKVYETSGGSVAVPELNMGVIALEDQVRADLTYKRIGDITNEISSLRNKWANEDEQMIMGTDVTQETVEQRKIRIDSLNAELIAQTSELVQMGVSQEEAGELAKWWLAQSRGENPAYPYPKPPGTKGRDASRQATRKRDVGDTPVPIEEALPTFKEEQDLLSNEQDVAEQDLVKEFFTPAGGHRDPAADRAHLSPVWEELRKGIVDSDDEFHAFTDADFAALMARLNVLEAGGSEAFEGEAKYIKKLGFSITLPQHARESE